MMNRMITFLMLMLWLNTCVVAQEWNLTGSIPLNGGRYEDVYFHDADLGWTVNSDGRIYGTQDGGVTWTQSYQGQYYLRSVEFLDENIGIVGSLDSVVLRTEDGGASWTEIQESFPVPIPGICGLAHFGDYVYGVGYFGYPAYFIKSTDKGETWTYVDLSAFADGMVDVHFVDQNVGFIAGIDEDSGAIILKTEDGGDNWELVLDTQGGLEYIWKLDFVTDQIAYGSVESFAGNAKIVKSVDGGNNWEIIEVSPNYYDFQGIGFINENEGWVGPRNSALFETNDGGQSWTQISSLPNINRFFRLNPSLIFASGHEVYKFEDSSVATQEPYRYTTHHGITAMSPNPFSTEAKISIRIDSNTFARLDLFDVSGHAVQNLYAGQITKGEHIFEVTPKTAALMPNGVYYLVLRTKEGAVSTRCLKVSGSR